MPILLTAALLIVAPPQVVPSLSRDEVVRMFATAEFKIDGTKAVDACGRKASPQVRFIDLNGNSRPEAEIVDVAPDCYGKPGVRYALLDHGGDGLWRPVISDDGSNALAPLPEDAAADRASLASLGAADRTAIFKAAGATPVGGGDWTMCTDDKTDRSTISSARDINGDGRPDAIVIDSGDTTMCYGNTGQAYALVSQQADGRWMKMIDAIAIPILLSGRGLDGYPDIANGGPGTCFAVLRWNGREYREIGGTDGGGHACSLN